MVLILQNSHFIHDVCSSITLHQWLINLTCDSADRRTKTATRSCTCCSSAPSRGRKPAS